MYNYQPKVELQTEVIGLRGSTRLGTSEVGYSVGYAAGETTSENNQLLQSTETTNGVDPAWLLLSQVIDGTEGEILSLFSPRTDDSIPLPLLSQVGFDALNSSDNFSFFNAVTDVNVGENERYTAGVDFRLGIETGPLKDLEIGLDYERSDFSRIEPTRLTTYLSSADAPSFSDLGLSFDTSSFSDIGLNSGFGVLGITELRRFFESGLASFPGLVDIQDVDAFSPGSITRNLVEIDPLSLDRFTREEEVAAYIQGEFEFGNLGLIAGIRYSRFDVQSQNIQSPTVLRTDFTQDVEFALQNRRTFSESVSQDSFLPRILLNYRWNDNSVLRAAYYQSIARPQIGLLSQNESIQLFEFPFFSPNRDRPTLFVNRGNPALKPATTDSYDLSFEYYDDTVGVVKLGLFLKRIKNQLESNISQGDGNLSVVNLPDDPRFDDIADNPQDYFIVVTTPRNSDDVGEIWGIETVIEKQFSTWPGVLGGFGVAFNYTFTDSEKQQPYDWFRKPVVDASGSVAGFEQEQVIFPDVRFNNQPKHSGTIGITFNNSGIDASLAYTAQSRRPLSFGPNNRLAFEESFDSLDFRFEYFFNSSKFGDYRLFLEGNDLLKSNSDAGLESTIGTDSGRTPKYYNGGQYYGGRELRIGLVSTF